MKPTIEISRILRQNGKKIKLVYGLDKVDGNGLFQKIFSGKPEEQTKQFDPRGFINDNSYCLWAVSSKKMLAIDRVICCNKTYKFVSGCYDETLGCWRLIVEDGV